MMKLFVRKTMARKFPMGRSRRLTQSLLLGKKVY